MEWNNLYSTLKEYAHYLDECMQRNMPDKWALKDAIIVTTNIDGKFYEVLFDAPSYWIFADQGRSPGKMPPKQAIDDWIERRQIVPYATKDGKLPTKDQLSFLIRRKIANEGTEGTPFYDKSVEETGDYFETRIAEAINKDIKTYLSTMIF